VLLLSDRSQGERRTDEQVAGAVLTSVSTAKRTRWRFLQEGLEAALEEKPRPGRPPKITGEIEAQLTVLACSQPPEGHAHWTLRLLAGRLVELGYLESISHAAVGNRFRGSPRQRRQARTQFRREWERLEGRRCGHAQRAPRRELLAAAPLWRPLRDEPLRPVRPRPCPPLP
jgi:transposase